MLLYFKEKHFDSSTGKELEPILRPSQSKFICDFSGSIIEMDNDETKPLYSISIDYNHDSKPLWYEEFHEFDEKYGLDYGEFSRFMSSPYHFSIKDYGAGDDSIRIIRCLSPARTLEEALRDMRLQTLRELLEEKKFTKEELGFSESFKT